MATTTVHTANFLLVEDDADDALLTQRAFKKANIWNPIDAVSSAEDAWNYLTQQGAYADKARYPKPLCVLLDLNMPGMDGRELIAKMGATENLKEIPVVVISTSDYEKDMELVRSMGAKHYIIKPLKMQSVLQVVASLPNVSVVLGTV